MEGKAVYIDEGLPPWDTVCSIAKTIKSDSWVLVGGLMVQTHALLAGKTSRSTKDVDMLINLMTAGASVSALVRRLEGLGFAIQEPGLRGGPFHRMKTEDRIVDILVADHLPSHRQTQARLRRWPMMEIPGGAQALDRRVLVEVHYGQQRCEIAVPNLLGAIVLKAAAFQTDRRDRGRHLQDAALLCACVGDARSMRMQMRGSDSKRLLRVWEALDDPNHQAWLMLAPEDGAHGRDVLRILSH